MADQAIVEEKERGIEEHKGTSAHKIRVDEVEKALQDAENERELCAAELALAKNQLKAKAASPAGSSSTARLHLTHAGSAASSVKDVVACL